MPVIPIPSVVLEVLVTCALTAIALMTIQRVRGNVRGSRHARDLAEALEEIERLKRGQSDGQRSLDERLTRIEHSMETLTLQMERLGEGQRFVTRLLTPGANSGAS